MTEINSTNFTGVNKVAPKAADKASADAAKNEAPQMKEMPSASLGKDLVRPVVSLNANEPYNGKTFDVQAEGNGFTTIDLVTPENIDYYSKFPDIWYQGGKEKAEAMVDGGEKDPRYIHPHVGGTVQYYDPVPLSDDYVTKDPETIEYARNNGFTVFNDKGEECFVNRYNGDRDVIEDTYTDADGNLLKDAGGVTGKIQAIQTKEMKVALLPVGSRVKPLNDENAKTVGVGDVVCCAAKKGKAKNDWYVRPVTDFLKTAKKNPAKGNDEFINALESYVALGKRDPAAWDAIVNKYGK